MKTKLITALLLCCVVGACSNEEPAVVSTQEEAFKVIEAYGEALHKADYEAAWEFLSEGRQEIMKQLLTQPVTGAHETVKSTRMALESEFTAESEKERLKGVLANFPPWETLKDMSPKQYYVWRMKKDVKSEAQTQSKAFYHRDNVREMVLEGGKGHIDWVAKGAERQYLILENEKWKIGLNPKLQREFEASKTKPEKR